MIVSLEARMFPKIIKWDCKGVETRLDLVKGKIKARYLHESRDLGGTNLYIFFAQDILGLRFSFPPLVLMIVAFFSCLSGGRCRKSLRAHLYLYAVRFPSAMGVQVTI